MFTFLISNFEWVKMLLLLVLAIVHQHMLIIEKKDILVLGGGPAQGLDQTAITAKHKYSINVTRSRKKTLLKSALKLK